MTTSRHPNAPHDPAFFGDSPNLTDAQHDLYDRMSEISEEGWCAGWIGDNEYTLWDAITLCQPESKFRAINPRLLRRCKKLSEEIGGWIRWTPDGPEFVPMAQWLHMVETHQIDQGRNASEVTP